jgi:hypothetical protein
MRPEDEPLLLDLAAHMRHEDLRLRIGVGYLLMRRLIIIARQRGIGELVGEVLRENEPMLQMCRELNFMIAPEPTEPRLCRSGKRLTTE